jgi:hypothetical protein
MDELNANHQELAGRVLGKNLQRPPLTVASLSEFILNRLQRRIGETHAGKATSFKCLAAHWKILCREADETFTEIVLREDGSQSYATSKFLKDAQAAHMADILWYG